MRIALASAARILAFVVPAVTSGCGAPSAPTEVSPQSTATAESAGSSVAEAASPAPDSAPSASPSAGDKKKIGTVPPGGKCRRDTWEPAAKDLKALEGGDDCAAVPAHGTPERPKGSVCIMESGPGAYCSHDCNGNSDCKDLAREGFVPECFGGGCLLTRKK